MKWKTLEELGFEEYGSSSQYDNFDHLFKNKGIGIVIYGDEYWHDTRYRGQELHKAIELKMIELGLWEE